ncbi:MAG: ABC transporter permease [Burkholderiales bacterium]|nr:ABC transporter permease [Burkholderiales bacterium]
MNKHRHLNIVSVLAVIGFISLWWLIAISGWVRPEFLPSPPRLVETFFEIVEKGYGGSSLSKHVGMSVMRAVSGFLLAVLVGVPFGILIGRNEVAYAIVSPIIGFLRPIPPIAFATLFVFYFGIGESSKIGLIFMAAFWYVVLNCSDGVRAVPLMLIRAGQSIGLNRAQLFFRVIVPAAMPAIMTALRSASSISWTLVVASELLGAQAGLGFIILDSAQYFNVPATFIGIVLIGVIGLVWELVLSGLQHRALHWQGHF